VFAAQSSVEGHAGQPSQALLCEQKEGTAQLHNMQQEALQGHSITVLNKYCTPAICGSFSFVK
jgi:hypothetical protein